MKHLNATPNCQQNKRWWECDDNESNKHKQQDNWNVAHNIQENFYRSLEKLLHQTPCFGKTSMAEKFLEGKVLVGKLIQRKLSSGKLPAGKTFIRKLIQRKLSSGKLLSGENFFRHGKTS